MRILHAVVVFLFYITLVFCCGRNTRPKDTTGPHLGCPADIRRTADPIQVHTNVYWEEPAAVDNKDSNIEVRRVGLQPGLLFSDTESIIYSAKDRSGNSGSCSFKVIVTVIRCKKWKKLDNGYRSCHPSHDMRLGTKCTFGCYRGHLLVGKKHRQCLRSGKWDDEAQPYCQKTKCDILRPAGKVAIKCTNKNNFRSVCSYICYPGYSIRPGYNHVQICQSDGYWSGAVPQCVDTAPPTFSNCPYVRTYYAEENKTSGLATWRTIYASDNSGRPSVVQIKGPSSGSELEVGEYDVIYTATDNANNKATCAFKIIMKQIRCTSIYPLPYTYVTCPTGRIYGSICEFSCHISSSLQTDPLTTCRKYGNTVKYGSWSFGKQQPFCELDNKCPELLPPANGAVACDTWLAGKVCQMLCKEGYAVDPEHQDLHNNLLVCGDDGDWNGGHRELPDCLEMSETKWERLKIDIDYLYYRGTCTDDNEDIRMAFIKAFIKSSVFPCNPPSCSISNVTVNCGQTTNHWKRDASITISLSLSLATTADTASSLRRVWDIRQKLQTAVNESSLDLDIGGLVLTMTSVYVFDPILICENGSAPDSLMINCLKCGLGYYHDFSVNRCQKCPLGTYQDDIGQSECIKCPNGTTTTKSASSSDVQCVEACHPGHYSGTGTPPCSPCDIGSYTTLYGTIKCQTCPGSQITTLAGSTSGALCHHFDITFTELDSNETLIPATIPVSNRQLQDSFQLSFWVRCDPCDNIIEFIDDANNTLIVIQDMLVLQTVVNGDNHTSTFHLPDRRRWSFVHLIISTNNTSLSVDNEVAIMQPGLQMSQEFTVSLGGDGFVGSISQFNIWNDTSVVLQSGPATCFGASDGDIVSWKQFAETDGTFIVTKTNCDVFDNCKSSPCTNGGICTDTMEDFICECPPGFEGKSCEGNIDDCQHNVCSNGATCVDDSNFYRCQCVEEYKGDYCEIKMVHGQWSSWESWSLCSVTCGAGIQFRERICGNPEPDNGGLPCTGEINETRECDTGRICINECFEEPTTLDNGTMNCDWVDNDTRVCTPTCDPGFDFDSDLFVYNSAPITCGLHTAYTWNIRNPDNPEAQLPSCTEIQVAGQNVLNFSATYPDLHVTNEEVRQLIDQKLNMTVENTTCMMSGQCWMDQVQLSQANMSVSRQRRSVVGVSFTLEITCVPTTDFQECYDLLFDVVTVLNDSMTEQKLSILYEQVLYDVDSDSLNLAGTSVCEEGSIPVMHYCVACGPGSYQNGDFCDRCERGTFQDFTGSASCKTCPDGWTTSGLQGRSIYACSVQIPYDWTIVIVSNVVVFGVLAVVLVTLLIYRKRKAGGAPVTQQTKCDYQMVPTETFRKLEDH